MNKEHLVHWLLEDEEGESETSTPSVPSISFKELIKKAGGYEPNVLPTDFDNPHVAVKPLRGAGKTVAIGPYEFLISYRTPIGVAHHGIVEISNQRYSVTTSTHRGRWLRSIGRSSQSVREVPQERISDLYDTLTRRYLRGSDARRADTLRLRR